MISNFAGDAVSVLSEAYLALAAVYDIMLLSADDLGLVVTHGRSVDPGETGWC